MLVKLKNCTGIFKVVTIGKINMRIVSEDKNNSHRGGVVAVTDIEEKTVEIWVKAN